MKYKIILIAIGVAVLYWFLEPAVHVFVFRHGNLTQLMFNPASHEMMERLIPISLLIVFMVYAQFTMTKRKRVEEKLQQMVEGWSVTFDSITDLVSIHDKDFKIVRVNKAYANAFKLKPQQLIDKTCYEIVHGTKEPWPNCPHKRTLKTKKPVTVEFFEPHLGAYLEVATSPIFDDKGNVTSTVHLTKDITERKRMEEALRESEEKYRGLVNHIKLGIFRSTPGPTGRFLEVNPALEELTGYSRKELLQMNVSDLYLYPEEREAVLEEAASAIGKAIKEIYFRKKMGVK